MKVKDVIRQFDPELPVVVLDENIEGLDKLFNVGDFKYSAWQIETIFESEGWYNDSKGEDKNEKIIAIYF